MKIYSKAYKTYKGARKRMLLEKACAVRSYVWGVRTSGIGVFHVTRMPHKEFERELAIAAALAAFDFDRDVEDRP